MSTQLRGFNGWLETTNEKVAELMGDRPFKPLTETQELRDLYEDLTSAFVVAERYAEILKKEQSNAYSGQQIRP